MPWIILLGIGALIFGGMFAATRAKAATLQAPEAANVPASLDELFVGFAAYLPPLPVRGDALLKALARKESNLNPDAVRNNPPNDVSVGLMQVLCIPDENGVCRNKFNIDGWPATFDSLRDPETNLRFAVQILAYNLKVYGFPKGIAVYNSWSARDDAANGPFRNQQYVDDVLRYTQEYSQ